VWVRVVVTHVTSYDVLVGGIMLYLLGVIWTFGRKLLTINQDGRHEIVVRFFCQFFSLGATQENPQSQLCWLDF
jgi:hypothetical protein